MEFFQNAKAVKLRSHLDKYLVADDDRHTVRQSRNGSSRKARWLVELVENDDSSQLIRLKSCHGNYLTASDTPFLLGMTGKRVTQTVHYSNASTKLEPWIEWEPKRDGFQVKLLTRAGKYLRANGGTPPWRNTVTHDNPQAGGTKSWVLWDVQVVEIPESEDVNEYLSTMSSFSSVLSDDVYSLEPESPMSVMSSFSPRFSSRKVCIFT